MTDDLALAFVEVVHEGRPHWLASTGEMFPVVRGGADDNSGGEGGPGDGSGSGEGSDGGAGAGGDGSGAGSSGEGGSGATGSGGVSFTAEQQAHIDKLIAKATGKAKGTAEKELKTWLDQQAMSEADRAKAEKAAADQLVAETRREALVTKVETAAERYALAAKVKPERVTKFMRLVDLDLDKLTDDGKPDDDAIKALIEAEARANPEFLTTASPNGAGGASGGEFNGSGDGKIWTRAEIGKLSEVEYEKHEKEILAQVAKGVVK